ncbi:MAG: N-acetyltransferase [Chloroflexi bacterium]|nr:N-acetyltransferase [Chloroflexota bacterium]
MAWTAKSQESLPRVEKARIGDVPDIHRLVNFFADRGEMLPRALSEIYESIRDYLVVRDAGRLVGCVALHVSWADLAEIKALAVDAGYHNQGVGALLIEACLGEAEELGIPSLFCLTYKPVFFEKLGFRQVDKMELPRKIWSECYRCPKFPNCDEVALTWSRQLVDPVG